jgi:hypothetical protein
MSLIHYVKPFLELGICKEYSMARKTTGNTTPKRSKKTGVPAQAPALQVAPEVEAEVQKEVQKEESQIQVQAEARAKVAGKNGRDVSRTKETGKVAPGNGAGHLAVHPPVNLEEEIRRRAYELYLQRRATAGAGNGHEHHGDEHQDWLIAENEILSRHNKLARHTTA